MSMSGFARIALFLLLAAPSAGDAAMVQPAASSIAGRVVDLATGEPIAGARVILFEMMPSAGSRPAAPPATRRRPITGETNGDAYSC
jgi:hypothetical protein